MGGRACLSRRRLLSALALAAAGAACRAPRQERTRPSWDAIAEQYVRLSLQLAQHQPSLVETWLGPSGWRPGPRRPVANIRREIESLKAAASARRAAENARVDNGELGVTRAEYLGRQIDALAVAARRLSGESMRFLDEARAALGADAADLVVRLQDFSDEIASSRAALERLLPSGPSLAERYTEFRHRHALPPTVVHRAFDAAIEECRRRVAAQLALPPGEALSVAVGTGARLEARALYQGGYRSRILIASAGPLDLAHVVWLAAHETYPGHHMQYVLAQRDLIDARGQIERALHPAFGRHLLLAEGAADAGALLLLDGEVFAQICRDVSRRIGHRVGGVDDLVAIHRAVVRLDGAIAAIACAYLDDEIGAEQAAARLAAEALVPDAHQFVFTIERQRSKLLAYPVGRRLVADRVAGVPAARRWEMLQRIATTLALRQDTATGIPSGSDRAVARSGDSLV